jgi:hypothetical protein
MQILTKQPLNKDRKYECADRQGYYAVEQRKNIFEKSCRYGFIRFFFHFMCMGK